VLRRATWVAGGAFSERREGMGTRGLSCLRRARVSRGRGAGRLRPQQRSGAAGRGSRGVQCMGSYVATKGRAGAACSSANPHAGQVLFLRRRAAGAPPGAGQLGRRAGRRRRFCMGRRAGVSLTKGQCVLDSRRAEGCGGAKRWPPLGKVSKQDGALRSVAAQSGRRARITRPASRRGAGACALEAQVRAHTGRRAALMQGRLGAAVGNYWAWAAAPPAQRAFFEQPPCADSAPAAYPLWARPLGAALRQV
jgi:hypothetical protein